MRYDDLHFREINALMRMKAKELKSYRFNGTTNENAIADRRAVADSIHELIDAVENIQKARGFIKS